MESTRVGLYRVLPETLPTAWPVLGYMLREAVEYNRGDFTLNDVLGAITRQEWQLWTVVVNDNLRAALVTEILQFSGRKVCQIVLLGGFNFNEWKEKVEFELENWALFEGCTALRAICRPGMAKMLRTIGYEPYAEVVVKDLRGRLQ